MPDEMGEEIDMRTLMGLYDAPAYVRRARNVEGVLQHVLGQARAVREEWLLMSRLRVGVLHALAGGDWSVLRPWLVDDAQAAVLAELHQRLAPKLRVPPEPTRSSRALRRALSELLESVQRFNARWLDYLKKVDVTVVNEVREGYNRYYLLEKSCAIRNEAVVKAGFVPQTPLDLEELLRHLPPLPVPQTTS